MKRECTRERSQYHHSYPFSTICFAFYIGRHRVNLSEGWWSESSLQDLVGMATFRSFPGRVKIRLANWFDEGGVQMWRFTHTKHNLGTRQPVELLLLLLNSSTESDIHWICLCSSHVIIYCCIFAWMGHILMQTRLHEYIWLVLIIHAYAYRERCFHCATHR